MRLDTNRPPGSIAVAVLLVTCSIGCGARSPQGVAASGTVTLDGRPVRNATAVFTPQDLAGHSITVRVIDGQFRCDESAGLGAGQFDVCVISAEPELEEVEAAHREGEVSPLNSSRIPVIYQKPGALTATVTEDGPNQFEFALSTRRGRFR